MVDICCLGAFNNIISIIEETALPMYEPSLSFSIPPLDPDSPALLPSLRASQHDSSAQHVPFRLQSLAGLPDRFRLPPLLDDDYHHDNRIGSGDQAQASKGAHDDPVLHTFLSREHTLGPASELLRTSLQANFARVPDELWNDEPGRSAHQERLPRSATSSDSQSDSEIYEDRGEGSSSSGRMLQVRSSDIRLPRTRAVLNNSHCFNTPLSLRS